MLRPIAATLLLLSAAASAQTPIPAVTVALDSFAFAPRTLRLAADRPVRLTFTNLSGSRHDFTAKRFFATARMISGAAPNGQIDLGGSASQAVTLVPARGRYKVHCGRFGHKLMGMTGKIIVK